MDDRYEFKASALRYGKCEGGPSDGKMLAHHADTYRLAIDKLARKTIPGLQASDSPDIKFGTYYFHGRVWVWEKPPEGQRMKLDVGQGTLDLANRR